jgi:diguanylate cyclase (GGDEF)-like protein
VPVEAFQAPKRVARSNFVRSLVSDQLRIVLEHRSTRFAVVGVLLVLASLTTLVPTPEGVDLAWMFIVPVAISAIAGGLREGTSVALISALISALYATAQIGRVDFALVGTVLVGRVLLYGITASILGAFAEAHQAVQSRLRDLASLDPLTKVSNVARFYDEMGLMEAQNETFAVLLVDVDDLKVLNDRYGHQVGSAAIRTVANALRKVVRASDCVARFGGDEFVMILKGADHAGAQIVVNRLRSVLADEFLPGASEASVTVSVGVAMSGEDGHNSEELLAHADEAMYADKRTRKGQAVRS